MPSTLPRTNARFGSRPSNAPAIDSVSSPRLFKAFGVIRDAKSDSDRYGPSAVRDATIVSTADAPMFFNAANEYRMAR